MKNKKKTKKARESWSFIEREQVVMVVVEEVKNSARERENKEGN